MAIAITGRTENKMSISETGGAAAGGLVSAESSELECIAGGGLESAEVAGQECVVVSRLESAEISVLECIATSEGLRMPAAHINVSGSSATLDTSLLCHETGPVARMVLAGGEVHGRPSSAAIGDPHNCRVRSIYRARVQPESPPGISWAMLLSSLHQKQSISQTSSRTV